MEKNELTLFNNNTGAIYCSKITKTAEEKKDLFNALESCDALLNDCVGQEITIKDVYCEEKQVVDEETGETRVKYRTILFDVSGQTYATGSYGIFNVMKKIFAIYGYPTWDEGITVKVSKRPVGNGKTSLTLTLV